MRARRWVWAFLAAWGIMQGAGCSSRPLQGSAPASEEQPPQSTEILAPYAPGAWRLASFDELARTMLWVSHILIRHDGGQEDGMPLRPLGWSPDAPSARSPEDARRLAESIAAQAWSAPETFEALAATHSEDVVTRALGGSLGGRRASELPASFLDAIAELAPGHISRPVQTSLGYHVLLLRNPPPAEDVAGQRVVIRYAGTSGAGSVERTRAEALARATAALADAQRGAPFEELTVRYAEGLDQRRGPSTGVFRTNEPSSEPIVVEALARTATDAVFPGVLESPTGFQVVKRVVAGPRRELGAHIVAFDFDLQRADSVAAARRAAVELIDVARRDPSALVGHRQAHVARWYDGMTDPLLSAAVLRLQVGEVTHEPIELEAAYAVALRLPVAGYEPPPLEYELPRPRLAPLPEIDRFVHDSQPEQLAFSVASIREHLVPFLTEHERPGVVAALALLTESFATASGPEERVAAYRHAMRSIERVLSPARNAAATALIQRWLSEQKLQIFRP